MVNKNSKAAVSTSKKVAPPTNAGIKAGTARASKNGQLIANMETTPSNVGNVSKASKGKTRVVQTTMFSNTSLDIIRSKIIKNRAPTQHLSISSERVVRKELEAMKVSAAITKDMKTIRKNKAFLGLVDSWKFKVLEIANNLTDYVPEENRMRIKKTLNSKIRKFRVDNVPLNKPRYSS